MSRWTPRPHTVRRLGRIALPALALTALLAGCASTPGNPMTFFLTSAGPGQGGNLGGLAGADAHCEKLAASAGAGGKNWRAYLSTQGPGAINARDRIGKGPWTNASGVVVASSVDELHSDRNNLNKQTALTEKGQGVTGNGDPVNNHDILTGSNTDGRVMPGTADLTCSNWTSGTTGSAMVGHHDRRGLDEGPGRSWNAAHPSRGCSQADLRGTGGAGLFYCFAAK